MALGGFAVVGQDDDDRAVVEAGGLDGLQDPAQLGVDDRDRRIVEVHARVRPQAVLELAGGGVEVGPVADAEVRRQEERRPGLEAVERGQEAVDEIPPVVEVEHGPVVPQEREDDECVAMPCTRFSSCLALFPFLRHNRAVFHLYDGRYFVNDIVSTLDRLKSGPPFLLAAHLCIGHWPYFHASPREFEFRLGADPRMTLYDSAVSIVNARAWAGSWRPSSPRACTTDRSSSSCPTTANPPRATAPTCGTPAEPDPARLEAGRRHAHGEVRNLVRTIDITDLRCARPARPQNERPGVQRGEPGPLASSRGRRGSGRRPLRLHGDRILPGRARRRRDRAPVPDRTGGPVLRVRPGRAGHRTGTSISTF